MKIKILKNSLLFVFALVLCVHHSCKLNRLEKKSENFIVSKTQINPLIDSTIAVLWQLDSLGCQGIRSKSMAQSLLKHIEGDSITLENFLSVLGTANKTMINNKKTTLCYFFNSVCQHNRLSDESDRCFAMFIFKRNIFSHAQFICN